MKTKYMIVEGEKKSSKENKIGQYEIIHSKGLQILNI